MLGCESRARVLASRRNLSLSSGLPFAQIGSRVLIATLRSRIWSRPFRTLPNPPSPSAVASTTYLVSAMHATHAAQATSVTDVTQPDARSAFRGLTGRASTKRRRIAPVLSYMDETLSSDV